MLKDKNLKMQFISNVFTQNEITCPKTPEKSRDTTFTCQYLDELHKTGCNLIIHN